MICCDCMSCHSRCICVNWHQSSIEMIKQREGYRELLYNVLMKKN